MFSESEALDHVTLAGAGPGLELGLSVGSDSRESSGLVRSAASIVLDCLVEVADNASVWVCVAALALLDRLDLVDRDLTGAWLSERQLPNGGLNGRPEKLEDVSASGSCFRSLLVARRSLLVALVLVLRLRFSLLIAI